MIIERLTPMSNLLVGLRYEDGLEGFCAYNPLRERIKLVPVVNKIWYFAEKYVNKSSEPKELEVYEEMDMRAKLIILEGFKDPLIPHVSGKNGPHEMWKYLHDLFKNKNENRLLLLKDNLKATKIIQGEGVTSYLTRLSQV